MIEEYLVSHCAPTLAGLKTASLFRYRYEKRQAVIQDLRDWNTKLSEKGLRLIPLRWEESQVLLYLFRPAHLKRDLANHRVQRMLDDQGYCCDHPERCLAKLSRNLVNQEDFPHEIGLFLGYPPEDVEGFICNRPCKLRGHWKVYGDVAQAKKTFHKYRKCTAIYRDRWEEGKAVEHLAVRDGFH